MNILLPENRTFNTAQIPNAPSELYYCVFDYSNLDDTDYQFLPMVFVEDFAKASAELKIGDDIVQVPLSWSILIGEQAQGDMELMPIMQFHGRDFEAFAFNPINGFMAEYRPIEIINIYQEVRWCVPSMKPEHLLAVPTAMKKTPTCVFFSDSKSKFPDELDVRHMIPDYSNTF